MSQQAIAVTPLDGAPQSECPTQRRAYSTPQFTELGSVLELTRGAGSSSLDFDRLTRQRA
jgi:hypothetical protein